MKGCSSGISVSPRTSISRSLAKYMRHDRDLLDVDVLPDVHLGPVREREDAQALAGMNARVVEVPQLRALVLGIPLALFVAEGEDAFLGAGFLFVAPRAADGRVEAARAQPVQQGLGLQQSAAALRAQPERVRAVGDRLLVGIDDQLGADLRACSESRNSIISRNL